MRSLLSPIRAVAFGLLLATGVGVQAQEEGEKPDPIDVEIERLEHKDPSTNGAIQAAAKGCELWDHELNRVYQELLKALPAAAQREKVKSSQRVWIAFRDANRAAIRGVYGAAQGTMYLPMAVYAEMNVTKARTLQLRRLLEVANESR